MQWFLGFVLGAATVAFFIYFRGDSTSARRYQLSLLVERLHDGVVLLGDHNEVLLANRRAAEFLELEAEGSPARIRLALHRIPDLMEFIQAVRQGHNMDERVIVLGYPHLRHLRIQASVLEPGRSRGDGTLLLTLTDVTRLEQLERVRRRFTADLSHQLRTPVTAIRLLSENLQVESQVGHESVERILREADRLERLIHEILTLSRLESGDLPFRPEVFAIRSLIDEAVDTVRTQAENKGIDLHIDSVEGERWRADYQRILRTVEVLLDNAVKYSPAAGMVVVATGMENSHQVLTVTDQGLGMSEDEQQQVFHRFFRGQHGATESGFGLGLAIAKHAVAAHGGELILKSQLGKGSTVGFRLPRDI